MDQSDDTDEEELQYQCGDCGDVRPESAVSMVGHPNESAGSFPICSDRPCSIAGVPDPTVTSSEFRVDEEVE